MRSDEEIKQENEELEKQIKAAEAHKSLVKKNKELKAKRKAQDPSFGSWIIGNAKRILKDVAK